MVAEESKSEREAREREKAELAFNDYFNLGPNRSIAALMRLYVKTARDEGPERVPTRHKPTLSKWREQYRWDERCLAITEKRIESERRDFDTLRRFRMEDLMDLSGESVKTLKRLVTNDGGEIPERIQLLAAQTILDRIGITPKGVAVEAKNASASMPAPSPDDDAATLAERYANWSKA